MNITTPCMNCGQVVTIYPPEDGDGPALCGRCANSPTAVALRPDKSALQVADTAIDTAAAAASDADGYLAVLGQFKTLPRDELLEVAAILARRAAGCVLDDDTLDLLFPDR